MLYYLVSRSGCGESGLGANAAGYPRPNDDPCPGSLFDADGDGAISEAEFDEAMARFMERRGGGHGQGERRGHGFWRG